MRGCVNGILPMRCSGEARSRLPDARVLTGMVASPIQASVLSGVAR